MAHQQQIEFCELIKKQLPHFFSNKFVIDIGSFDVNGNNHYLFENCLYLGVDLFPGKNVDLATKGHELNLPNESVDVVISTECLEHDQFYALTLQNIARILKPGGALIFTCATIGRAEHGTRRTTPEDAPFTQELGEWGDYYKNLEEMDIRSALDIERFFDKYAFTVNTESHDLYFWGIKKGTFINRYDYSFQLHQPYFHFTLGKTIGNQELQIANLNLFILERDGQLKELNATLVERDGQLNELNTVLIQRDGQLHELNTVLIERDGQLHELNTVLIERDDQLNELNTA